MTRRMRAEDGFTMTEFLIALFVLTVVFAGAMTLMQVVLRQSRGVIERTDAMQRGRLVLDSMTREIRSQVCLNASTYGLVAGTTNSIKFYTDFSDGSPPAPELHQLAYDPVKRQLTRTTWNAANVATTKTVLSGVVPVDHASAPVFQFYKYNGATPPEPTTLLTATDLTNPDERVKAARIALEFEVLPTGEQGTRFGTQMKDEVLLRTADPNSTKPDPTCR